MMKNEDIKSFLKEPIVLAMFAFEHKFSGKLQINTLIDLKEDYKNRICLSLHIGRYFITGHDRRL